MTELNIQLPPSQPRLQSRGSSKPLQAASPCVTKPRGSGAQSAGCPVQLSQMCVWGVRAICWGLVPPRPLHGECAMESGQAREGIKVVQLYVMRQSPRPG